MKYFEIFNNRESKKVLFVLPDEKSFIYVPRTPESAELAKKSEIVSYVIYAIYILSFTPAVFLLLDNSDLNGGLYLIPIVVFIGEILYRWVDYMNQKELSTYQSGSGYNEYELPSLLQLGRKQLENRATLLMIILVLMIFLCFMGKSLFVCFLVTPYWFNLRLGKLYQIFKFFKNGFTK